MIERNRIITICLIISVILNVVLLCILLKNSFDMNSYEGTWKCTSNPNYEITIFVDHNGTFYEALDPITPDTSSYGITITDILPFIVYKGYIEKDSLVYKGVKIIENGDHYEYLSDIPDDQYEAASYYYTIIRNSKTTLMLEIPGDSSAKYTFVKTDEQ